MARSARACERSDSQRVVDAAHAGDVNDFGVEQLLATRNTGARGIWRVGPGIIQVKDRGVERRAERIEAEARRKRVVDSNKELLTGQWQGSAAGAICVQVAGA